MIAENILQEAVRRLVEQFDPQQIILFGSQARRTADDRSDVDLLVVCPFEGDWMKLSVAMDASLRGLGMARDIVVMTPDQYETLREVPGTVARPAWLEGKVLYERAA